MQQIKKVSVAEHSRAAWIRYAKYAVEDRAVPDLRDGLIPVRRRLLYGMHKIPGLTPTSARIKSAKVVGDTMGSYHPHGDSGIYESLVNMSQPFKNNLMYVDPKGNWGSLEGDPAAAMRYTEIRPAKNIELMLKGIDKGIVKFVPTFDGENTEPEYLPAVVPNLLINGHIGIASGYNSIHLPHNVDEAIDACLLVLDNPDATVADIMTVLPGPDFPVGGIVINAGDLEKIYSEGKGTVSICGNMELDYESKRIKLLSVPFTSSWDRIKEGLVKLEAEGKLPHVLRVIDEKDHYAIVVNNVDNMQETAETIKKRFMSTSLHMFMLVIGEHGLKKANLKDLIKGFLEHRVVMTKKSLQYDIDQLVKERNKISTNVFLAEHREEVLQILNDSKTKKEAIEKIVALGNLTPEQSEYLINLQLHHILKEEADKAIIALKENEAEITELKQKLENEEAIKDIIRAELLGAKNGVPRKTTLVDEITRDKETIKLAKQQLAEEAELIGTLPALEEGTTDIVTATGVIEANNNDIITVVSNNGLIRHMRAGEWNEEIGGTVLHDTTEDHFVVLKTGAMGMIPIDNSDKKIYLTETAEENDVLGVFPNIDFTHLVVMTNMGRFAAINAESLKRIVSPIPLITLNPDEFIERAYRVDNSQKEHCLLAVNEIGEYFKTDLSDTAWLDHSMPITALPFSKNENIRMILTGDKSKVKLDLNDGESHIIDLGSFIKLNRNSETCKYRVKLRAKTTVVGVSEC